jgi:hypothetical protein
MSKTYYKVVSVRYDGQYYSALTHPTDFTLRYPIGEWVHPRIKGSKIFIFDNYDSAERFAKTSQRNCSWGGTPCICECEAQGVSKTGISGVGRTTYYAGILRRLFRLRAHKKAFRSLWKNHKTNHRLPTGTVFADSIKIMG